jgi:predicted ATPase
MRDDALEPVQLPGDVWSRPETRDALRERRVGYLFALAKKYAGASQTRIANVTGMDQSEVSRIMKGDRQISAIDVLERVARGLLMPDPARALLGLAPQAQPTEPAEPTAVTGAPEARRGMRRLPAPLTELVGREAEIETVTELLSSRRLMTLAGPPGIGKTRLALAVAEAAADQFDSVVFVSLAEANAPEQVAALIAQALDVPEVAGQPLADTLATHVGRQRLLLVLDNFEHLLEAAPLIARLLSGGRGVRALVTSRERLRVSGEQIYSVPPLAVPDLRLVAAGDQSAALLLLASSSAVALFADRASAVAPEFVLNSTTMRGVAELCHRLDGLPLAIELAAARVGAFTPDELLADLAQRLDLISDGPRDVPARQQTMQEAIAWSFALLDPEEQSLLAHLAVFVGGCATEAAHQICAPTEPADRVVPRLAALVDKNLVRARPDPEGQTRYGLLETIRVFAAERLAERGELEDVKARHADYYAAFVALGGSDPLGDAQTLWAGRFDREYHNLQAAMSWALGHDDPQLAARIAVGLHFYWSRGRDIGGGRRWYERILAHPDRLRAELRARVLVCAARLACWQSDLEQAELLAERGLADARALGDRLHTAQALELLALTAAQAGRYERARAQYDEALDLYRDLGQARQIAVTLGNLGEIAFRLGDLDTAAARTLEALDLCRELGHRRGVLTGLANLGEIRIWQGNHDAARVLLTEAIPMSRELADELIGAALVHSMGQLAAADGDELQARRLYADALERKRDLGEQEDIAMMLQTMAGAAIAASPAFAARLLGAAAAQRERVGVPLPPVWQPSLQSQLGRLREALGKHAFSAAWDAGRTTPLDQTVDQALDWARKTDMPARHSATSR